MRSIAAGTLIVTLLSAPALAQPSTRPPAAPPMAPPASPIDRLGQIEPAPLLMPSSTMQLRNDLTILRAALESYRADHFFHYPDAPSVEALIDTLVHSDDLPEGFTLKGTVTEFVANRGGYRISARTNGDTLTIRTPERYDPFWAMIMQPL